MDKSERYELNEQTLHVHRQGDLGWAVWLNIEDIDYSGLCIATGATRNDAVGAAVRQLEGLVEVLQRPPINGRLR